MTKTKRELAIDVAKKLGITQSESAAVIEALVKAITENLSKGHRFELRDFGVFETTKRAARVGRNPRTGAQVAVPARQIVKFRPGKKMKEAVHPPNPAASE